MWYKWKKSVEATIKGHTLVVAFRTANPPMIWQFDLERNHSFTLALQGEEGDWELGITSPKGEFYPITRFLNKETAEDAFERVQKALTRYKSSWSKWIGRAVIGIFILIVIGIIGFLGMTGYSFYSAQQSAKEFATTRGNAILNPQIQQQFDGSPIVADQALTAPDDVAAPSDILDQYPQQPIPDDGTPMPADQLLEAPKD